MKHMVYSIIVVVLLLATGAAAQVEEITDAEYRDVEEDIIRYANVSDAFDPRGLKPICYVSDDEIWFGAHTWLVQLDSECNLISYTELSDVPLEDPFLSFITKTGDTLMLGFYDSGTKETCIGVFSDDLAAAQYYVLQGRIFSEGFSASSDGILAIGTLADEDGRTDTLWYASVNSEGEIETEYVWLEDNPEDFYCYDSLMIDAIDGGYIIFIDKTRLVDGKQVPVQTLERRDTDGTFRWMISLPDTTGAVEDICVLDDSIYVVGNTGITNPDGTWESKPIIYRYALSGELLETVTLDFEGRFLYCVYQDDCFTAIGHNPVSDGTKQYFLYREENDLVERTIVIQFEENHDIHGIFFNDTGELLALGHTATQLFILSME